MATSKQLVQTIKDGGYKESSYSTNTFINPVTSHSIRIENSKLTDNRGYERCQATIESAKKMSRQS